ncbi:unnamed protein product [Lymnaea stagnalis]|uniref:RING-type domain-containing protein n=1 Tax=Lymnaea stagnalis TaxID=6523 RepID=A0AAV2IS66_LYMST
MDIPKDLVESCVKKRLEENQGEFASIESLMEAVFSMNVTESAPSLKIASSATTTREKLAEEIQKLRDERLCKICMEEDACATFVPCGHLACCFECGLALEVCLICRSRIQSCVRTYIS